MWGVGIHKNSFSKKIDIKIQCENSGHDIFHDFAEVSKIVEAGATNKPVNSIEE